VLTILRSDPDFLLVYKPAGMPFHGEDKTPGVLQVIRDMEEKGFLPPGERLFPVHRLDTVTSGILVFARGRKNADALGNEFRFHRITKVYIAISDQAPTRVMGTVIGDIIKAREGSWKLTRETSKPSITHFLSFPYKHVRALRVFALKPVTGKTHQIRVVMKSLGSPILGDGRYGGYRTAREEDRTYLHAAAIKFHLNGRDVTFVCAPKDGIEFKTPEFAAVWKSLGNPLELKFPGEKKQYLKKGEEAVGPRKGAKPWERVAEEKPKRKKKKRPKKTRGNPVPGRK
jgi:tRNA pseudouridine32 synthase/23S rRNA pseudouridine746 synthase